MTTLDRETLALIDDRVKKALKRPQRAGTLVSRTGDITGEVLEDGAASSMSVLIAGDVVVAEGDRVIMCQFGSDWVVIGGLTPRFSVERQYEYVFTGETTTSSTFVDLPGIPATVAARTLVKLNASTSILAEFMGTCYATIGGTTVDFAAQLTNVDTSVVYGPQVAAFIFINTANVHTTVARNTKMTSIPAGTYDAKMQWRRRAGTGVVSTFAGDDSYSVLFRELTPQA